MFAPTKDAHAAANLWSPTRCAMESFLGPCQTSAGSDALPGYALLTHTAQLAMLQEWVAGAAVWLRGTSTEPFIAGEIIGVSEATVQVALAGGEVRRIGRSDAFAASSRTAPDHCALEHLNEPSVLNNTRLRFLAGAIYTSIGDVLVAINPFAALPIYGEHVMGEYVGSTASASAPPPHVYSMAEAAFVRVHEGRTTALIMSGESGSGKTETTKHLLEYIAWRTHKAANQTAGNGGTDGSRAGGGLAHSLASRLLSSSAMLEAFGNCKTVRNSNSSRFGKMMRLHFWPEGHPYSGMIAGGHIRTCAPPAAGTPQTVKTAGTPKTPS